MEASASSSGAGAAQAAPAASPTNASIEIGPVCRSRPQLLRCGAATAAADVTAMFSLTIARADRPEGLLQTAGCDSLAFTPILPNLPVATGLYMLLLTLGGAALLLIHPAPLLGPVTARQHFRCAAVRACEGASSEEERLEECRLEELEPLERCLRVATLEASAEQAESEKDLLAAIAAYEELLALQPPCSPNLREQDAARRALQAPRPPRPSRAPLPPHRSESRLTSPRPLIPRPCPQCRLCTLRPNPALHPAPPLAAPPSPRCAQELLLESARRELAACDEDEECSSFIEGELQRAQKLGEESRKFLAARSLADLGKVRATVVRLLELSESQAAEAAERARGTQSYQRLVDGDPGWLAGFQLVEARGGGPNHNPP